MKANGLHGPIAAPRTMLRETVGKHLEKWPRIYDALRSGLGRARLWRTELRERYAVRFVVLLYPVVIEGRFYKGVLWIMGNVAHVTRKHHDIRDYFWLISTASGSAQWAKGSEEDIHGLTLNDYADDYRAALPDGRCMVIRNVDFLDENDFYPMEVEKKYDLFSIPLCGKSNATSCSCLRCTTSKNVIGRTSKPRPFSGPARLVCKTRGYTRNRSIDWPIRSS